MTRNGVGIVVRLLVPLGLVLLLGLVCLVEAGCPAQGRKPASKRKRAPFSGRVVAVADGDTVTVLDGQRRVKVRLHGVDTPERRQAFGRQARLATLRIVAGKRVKVEVKAIDRYGRTVGRVCPADGGRCLGERLVADGLAWWYRKYDPKNRLLARLEAEAKQARRGLWADPNPVAPWKWRHARRGRASRPKGAKGRPPKATKARRKPTTPAEVTGAIRCNARSKACHEPSCRHYRCRRCTVGFDTLAAARKAGYHPHKACTQPRR